MLNLEKYDTTNLKCKINITAVPLMSNDFVRDDKHTFLYERPFYI